MKECPSCKGLLAGCTICNGTGEVFEEDQTTEEKVAVLEQKAKELVGLVEIISEHQQTHCTQIHTTLDIIVAILEAGEVSISEDVMERIKNAQRN